MYATLTVLTEITRRRGLRRPDGRPLHAYRVSAEELAQLKNALCARSKDGAAFSVDDAAGLALFVAETFCQNHVGGPWKWETATADLGLDPERIRRTYGVLESALAEFWRRPIIHDSRGGRLFHTTLACEGGLPRNLLAKQQGALGGLFRYVLRERERLPSNVRTMDLVADEVARLPAGLRGPEVIRLAADLVDAIAEFRRSVPSLSTARDPLAILNTVRPGWSDQLPLRLDDETARRLLVGLVSQEASTDAEAPCEVRAALRPFAGGWRLRRFVWLPSRVDPASLAGAFEVPDGAPGRLELVVSSDDAISATAGILTLSGDARFFRVEQRGANSYPPGSHLHAEVTASGRAVGKRFDPPGGLAMGDDPWVFVDQAPFEGLGSGSLRSRSEALLVAVPPDCRIEPDPEATVESTGILEAEGVANRLVYRIRGAVRCQPDGEATSYRIVTGAPGGKIACTLASIGFSALAGRGTEVLRGDPEVIFEEDGLKHRLGSNSIEYTRRGTRTAMRAGTPGPLGELWLRVVRDGLLLLRRKVIRVPANFQVKLQVGERGTGRILIRGVRPESVDAEQVPGVTCQKSGDSMGTQLTVMTGNPHPSRLGLRILFADAPPVRVEIPCPAREDGFIGLGGERLAPGTQVSVDRLLGVRAYAFDPDPGVWTLEARSCEAQIPWTAIGELRDDPSGMHVLPLDEVVGSLRLMLADGRMDTKAELRLARVGLRPSAPALVVAQYARALVPTDRGEGGAPSRIVLQPGRVDDLRLEVRPIGEPGAAPIVREGAPNGDGWDWPAEAGCGAWMCTAWERHTAPPLLAARPLFVSVQGEGTSGASSSSALGCALIVAELEKRRAALGEVLNDMSADPSHEDWPVLDEHLDTLGDMPAATFDVVTALARCQAGVALSTLRRAWLKPGDLRTMVHSLPTLPFAWWLVPPSAWANAAKRLHVWIGGIAGLSADMEMTNALEALATEGAILSTCAEWMRHVLGLAGNWARIAPAAGIVMQGAWSQAMQFAADARWPTTTRGLCSSLGLDPARVKALAPDPVIGYREHVATAPVLAALAAIECRRMAPAEFIALSRARAFDSGWFDTCWGMTLVRLSGDAASRGRFLGED